MRNTTLFVILFACLLTFGLIFKVIVKVDELIFNSLVEYFSMSQIEEYFSSKEKWEFLSYISIFVILLLKTSVIAAILDIGCFFFSKEIGYKKLFNIVVKAEFVFLLVILFKTVWFYFFKTDYNLDDLQYFYPLSALSIIGYKDLQPWFIYPFQILNLFELVYWFILSYLIGKELKENTGKGFSIVASSYGVSLFIWIVGVMFFALNMS